METAHAIGVFYARVGLRGHNIWYSVFKDHGSCGALTLWFLDSQGCVVGGINMGVEGTR